jgi:hypothetical protein
VFDCPDGGINPWHTFCPEIISDNLDNISSVLWPNTPASIYPALMKLLFVDSLPKIESPTKTVPKQFTHGTNFCCGTDGLLTCPPHDVSVIQAAINNKKFFIFILPSPIDYRIQRIIFILITLVKSYQNNKSYAFDVGF